MVLSLDISLPPSLILSAKSDLFPDWGQITLETILNMFPMIAKSVLEFKLSFDWIVVREIRFILSPVYVCFKLQAFDERGAIIEISISKKNMVENRVF
jgi:hypothetical protein